MAKVLIAGCGYVGRGLSDELAREGHDVWALRRSRPTAPAYSGIHWIQGDVCAPGGLAALTEAFDYVYYLVSADEHTPVAYKKAYVEGIANLLAHLAGQPGAPARLFFVSSTGVYSQNDGERVDEDSPAVPRSFSGELLLEGESLVGSGVLPSTVVRLSGIYGPGRERMIDSVQAGMETLREPDPRVVNHIHRDDCAGFLAHLMHVAKPSALYIGTDNEPAVKSEVLRWIAQALQIPAPPQAEAAPAPEERGPRGGYRFYTNARMRSTGYVLRYPSYREGYSALIAARKGNSTA